MPRADSGPPGPVTVRVCFDDRADRGGEIGAPAIYRSGMRGGTGRTGSAAAFFITAFGTALLTAAACGGPAPTGTSLPTFAAPTPGAGTSTGAPAPDDGAVPDDCGQLMSAADLGALMGLPLDSVTVRTTAGVPEPSIGRTERVTCRYTAAAGNTGGRTLLDLNVSAYTDADAAVGQWRVNAAAEDGARRELPIGSASAVLVERSGESVLLAVHGPNNLTFVLPARSTPGDRAPADALLDLALRVFPAVDVPPSATPSDPGPTRQADMQS